MVSKTMYKKIKQLKKRGFNIKNISAELNLDRGTVSKYFNMTETDFKEYQKRLSQRQKELDDYFDDIMDIYKIHEYRKLNVSGIYDYLEEKYGDMSCTEKTLRNYIKFLIQSGQLTLSLNIRQYSKVPQLPYGKQMQVDFGQTRLNDGTVLYIFAALLSASRYKYVAIQQVPFTTISVIHHLLDTFIYVGGRPKELVIDQDKLMVVSENNGDIIYTNDFNSFIQEMDLSIYVCKKADPESKGKIENTIKYVKYNFFDIRKHLGVDEIEAALPGWLKRRANGKISQATKRIPFELIEEERSALRTLLNSIFRKESLEGREDRTVDDKSYISVSASLYSVPTQYRNREVEIYQTKDLLFIFDPYSGKEVACHELSMISGTKITDKSHFREIQTHPGDLKDEVLNMFELDNWKQFAQENFKRFNRYVRDQCLEARKYFSVDIDSTLLDNSLQLCLENKSLSFANLHDTYCYFVKNEHVEELTPETLPENRNKNKIDVEKRELQKYTSAFLSPAGGNS